MQNGTALGLWKPYTHSIASAGFCPVQDRFTQQAGEIGLNIVLLGLDSGLRKLINSPAGRWFEIVSAFIAASM